MGLPAKGLQIRTRLIHIARLVIKPPFAFENLIGPDNQPVTRPVIKHRARFFSRQGQRQIFRRSMMACL